MPWNKGNHYYENPPRVIPSTLRTVAQQERCHGKPCPSGCQCGKHYRSPLHNELIGKGVKRANQRKKERSMHHLQLRDKESTDQ